MPAARVYMVFAMLCVMISALSGQTVEDRLLEEISPNNYFAIPESVENGDYVGTFYSLFYRDTVSAIRFEIAENPSGAYRIDSRTGLITIANNTGINVQENDLVHNLIIKSIDGEHEDIDTAFIRIRDSKYCIFIDPDVSAGGSGSRSDPYHRWANIAIRAGYAYFQKRNSTHDGYQVRVEQSGSANKPIIIGSYGKGSKPIFDGHKYQDTWVKGISTGSTNVPNVEHVQIYDLYFENWGGNGIMVLNDCRFIEINNCDFVRNGQYDHPVQGKLGPGLYLYGNPETRVAQFNYVRNCFSAYNTEHGFKAENTFNTFFVNCFAFDNGIDKGHGFQIVGGTNNKLYGLYAYRNYSYGISSRGINDSYQNIVCIRNYTGIQIWENPGSNLVSGINVENAITQNNNFVGIYLQNNVSSCKIIGFRSEGNEYGFRINGNGKDILVSHGVMARNKKNGFIIVTNANSNYENITTNYNLIYKNQGTGFEVDHAVSSLYIQNTTFYQNANYDIDVRNFMGNTGYIRNSIYGRTYGNFRNTRNLNYLNTNIQFRNSATDNFQLRENSPAIDVGLFLNLYSDLLGNPVPFNGVPDIGAYEYLPSTEQFPPAAPSNLQGAISEHKVYLTWNDNSYDESYFIIERRAGSSDFQVIDSTLANHTSYQDNSITESGSYTYRINAKNYYGSSSYSNDVQVQVAVSPDLLPPTSPTTLTLSHNSYNHVKIAWIDRSESESKFIIYRSRNGTSFVKHDSTAANMGEYTDYAVLANSKYVYKVLAKNQAGESNFSNSLTVITPAEPTGPPEAPSNLAHQFMHRITLLIWDIETNDELGTIIFRKDFEQADFEIIDTVPLGSRIYQDRTVASNTPYIYLLKAFNENGDSDFSDLLLITTPDWIEEIKLSVGEIDFESVGLNWEPIKGFSSELFRKGQDEETFLSLATIDLNSGEYIDNNVEADMTYQYYLEIKHNNSYPTYSDTLSISTLPSFLEKRNRDGLIAEYVFSKTYLQKALDISGYKHPLNLKATERIPNTLQQTKHSMVSEEMAIKIYDACLETEEFSFECWVKPKMDTDAGTYPIVSIGNADTMNFSFEIEKLNNGYNGHYSFQTRLNTEFGSIDGYPLLEDISEYDYSIIHHVVYTKAASGEESLFINGQKTRVGKRLGSINSWSNSGKLYLGHWPDSEISWEGDYYYLAFFNKQLTEESIQQNYKIGPFNPITDENQDINFQLELNPNPAYGNTEITVTASGNIHFPGKYFVYLTDSYGRSVMQEVLYDPSHISSFTLDTKNLYPGLYIVHVGNSSKLFDTKKLLIMP